MSQSGSYASPANFNLLELIPWFIALSVFFLAPDYAGLGARVMIFILFGLSLDLILGYGGIITLGHGALFGIGGYTAGILGASLGITEPFSQVAIGALVAATFGLLSGTLILRTSGLALLMLTLAVVALLHEGANRATWLTGGADGLSGISVAPVFGLFRFDLLGKTAYLYCLGFLFAGWLVARHIVHSPFGVMLLGIRENSARMESIGAPTYNRLLLVYTISSALAGIAGALMVQINQFVGLNVFNFELSAEILIMLILGGIGRLYGAFVGPAVYLVAQDLLAKQFPEYWFLGIGILLMAVVLFARDGILGISDRLLRRGSA